MVKSVRMCERAREAVGVAGVAGALSGVVSIAGAVSPVVAAAFAPVLLVSSAGAQDDVFWAAPVSGLWSNPDNWSSGPVPGLPGAEDRRVNIDLVGDYTVSLDFGANVSGLELTGTGARLALTTAGAGVSTAGMNRFANASIVGGQSNNLTTSGATFFTGSVTVNGLGNVGLGGTVDFSGSSLDLCDTCVFLTGNGTWSGGAGGSGTFTLQNDGMGSEFVVEAGGSLALLGAGPRTVQGVGGGNRFVNRGELRVALDGGADTFEVSGSLFQNSQGGAVRVETGTLRSDLAGTLSGVSLRGGDWFVGDGGTVDAMGAQIEAIDVAVELDGAGSAFAAIDALERVTTRGAFRVMNGRDFATGASVAFDVRGELEVGAGSAFVVTDTLANLSGNTLAGGSFVVGGELGLMQGDAIATLEAGLTLEGGGSIRDGGSGDLLAGLAMIGSDGAFALREGAAFTTAGDLGLDGSLDIGAGSGADVRGDLSAFQGGVFGDAALLVRGELIADNSRVEAVEGRLVVGLDAQILARDGVGGTVDGLGFLREIRAGGSVELAEGRDLDLRSAGNTVEIEGGLLLGATGSNAGDALAGSVLIADGVAFGAGSSLTTTLAGIGDFGRIDALSAQFGSGAAGETAGTLTLVLAEGLSLAFGDRFLIVGADTLAGGGFASLVVEGSLGGGLFFEQFVDQTGVGVRVVPTPAGGTLVVTGMMLASRRRRGGLRADS